MNFLKIILLLIPFAFINCQEQQQSINDKDLNKKAKQIKLLISELNNWNIGELIAYEEKGTLVSGESIGFIESHISELKQLNAFVIWNDKLKKYEQLQFPSDVITAIIQVEKEILKIDKQFECFLHKDLKNGVLFYFQKGHMVLASMSVSNNSIIKQTDKGEMKVFAVEYHWEIKSGNLYGSNWFLFKKIEGEWKSISNNFGFSKISKLRNSEKITSIENNVIYTDFYVKETEKYITKKYRIEEYKLIEIQ